MTSHPKDASQKLFDTMASSPKIAPASTCPSRRGTTGILKAMNRVYDRAGYLDKVRRLRQAIPDVVITSDVIVGFPGETAEEFEDTMTLIDEVRFDALFTFIFSPREGTPAAKMDDPIPKAEKAAHFQRWWSGRTRFRGKARRLHRKDGALSAGRSERRPPV